MSCARSIPSRPAVPALDRPSRLLRRQPGFRTGGCCRALALRNRDNHRASGRGSPSGDASLLAFRAARHACELAVGRCAQTALAFAGSQPPTRRYRLPEPTEELRAALTDEPADAIEAVF